MPEYGWADFIRQNQSQRSAIIKQFDATAARIEKIRASEYTKRIRYPEHQLAFDYVHDIYPVANVKQAMVYQCPKALLHEIGFGGAGGFYDTKNRVIVITDFIGDGQFNEFEIKAEFTIDEVLCHELIHFGANYRLSQSNRAVEEEIAYGKSIGYLRLKGRSDDFIINKNMLPYLMGIVNRGEVYRSVLLKHYDEKALSKAAVETIAKLLEPLGDEVYRAQKAAAVKIGQKMIDVYGGDQVVEKKATSVRKIILDDFE